MNYVFLHCKDIHIKDWVFDIPEDCQIVGITRSAGEYVIATSNGKKISIPAWAGMLIATPLKRPRQIVIKSVKVKSRRIFKKET